MTILTDRERSFEQKFQHDEDLQFKVSIRQAKLFAKWVAEHLNLDASATEQYKTALTGLVASPDSREKILDKAHTDIESKHIEISFHRLEKEFEVCHQQAYDSLMVDA